MSEHADELDESDDQPPDIVRMRQRIKQLEQENKEKSEAAQRAEAAERKLAFAEAGISLSDPKMKYFVNGYDGEVSAEAIKAAALEAGFLAPPEPSVPTEETEAQERIAAAGAGAGAASKPSAVDDISKATSEKEVMAILAKNNPELIQQG